MSGIEVILGTLYVAGTIRAAITTVTEVKKFSVWIKKKQVDKRRKQEEWNLIEVCDDEFVIVDNNKECDANYYYYLLVRLKLLFKI